MKTPQAQASLLFRAYQVIASEKDMASATLKLLDANIDWKQALEKNEFVVAEGESVLPELSSIL